MLSPLTSHAPRDSFTPFFLLASMLSTHERTLLPTLAALTDYQHFPLSIEIEETGERLLRCTLTALLPPRKLTPLIDLDADCAC